MFESMSKSPLRKRPKTDDDDPIEVEVSKPNAFMRIVPALLTFIIAVLTGPFRLFWRGFRYLTHKEPMGEISAEFHKRRYER